MPHRFDRAVLERDLAGRRSGPRRARHGGGRQISRPPRRRPGAAVHAALRSDAARSGYIKGYPPGIRENGGQYTHGAVWSVIAFAMLGDGDKAGELFSMLNPINHARTPDAVHRYKVEPYVVCGRCLFRCRRMSGAAAGPGTPARPDGCTGRPRMDPRISSAGRRRCSSIPASRRHGRASRSSSATAPRATRSRSRTRAASAAASSASELDGAALPGNQARIPLADDGATHRVRVVLG